MYKVHYDIIIDVQLSFLHFNPAHQLFLGGYLAFDLLRVFAKLNDRFVDSITDKVGILIVHQVVQRHLHVVGVDAFFARNPAKRDIELSSVCQLVFRQPLSEHLYLCATVFGKSFPNSCTQLFISLLCTPNRDFLQVVKYYNI